MAFNGNDAVGLFKNGVLIDIIGTFSINNLNKMYSIEIYSIIGQKIYSEENSTKSEITLPNSVKGTFLIRVTIDSNSVIKKLIIN